MARFGIGQWVDVEEFKGTVPWDTLPNDLYSGQEALELQAELKGSIGEGPNHSNFSDQSSVRILSKFKNFR